MAFLDLDDALAELGYRTDYDAQVEANNRHSRYSGYRPCIPWPEAHVIARPCPGCPRDIEWRPGIRDPIHLGLGKCSLPLAILRAINPPQR